MKENMEVVNKRKAPYTFQPFRSIECEIPRQQMNGRYIVATAGNIYRIDKRNSQHGLINVWSYNVLRGNWRLRQQWIGQSQTDQLAEFCDFVFRIGWGLLKSLKYIGRQLSDVQSLFEDTNVFESEQCYLSACVWHDDKVYVIGGFIFSVQDNYRMRMRFFNARTMLWTDLTNAYEDGDEEVLNRWHHTCICDGQRIYVIGGAMCSMESLLVFELATHKWSSVMTLPDQNRYPQSPTDFSFPYHTLDNGDMEALYLDKSLVKMNTVWKLNFRTFQWQLISIDGVTKPIFLFPAATDPHGRMYLQSSFNVTKIWMRIPKLTEMCWDALSHYYGPQMCAADSMELLKAGIPKRFVNRVNG